MLTLHVFKIKKKVFLPVYGHFLSLTSHPHFSSIHIYFPHLIDKSALASCKCLAKILPYSLEFLFCGRRKTNNSSFLFVITFSVMVHVDMQSFK